MAEERSDEQLPDIVYYRKMEPHDASAVSNLVTNVFCEAVITHFDAEGIADMLHSVSPENLVWRLHNGYFTLLAELNQQIVGMVEVREDDHVMLLFVDSSCQGRGIGAKLLQLAIRECRLRKPDLERMTVSATPNAIGFYEKEGFQATTALQHERGMRFLPMTLPIKDLSFTNETDE